MTTNEYASLYTVLKDLRSVQKREARRQDQYKQLTVSTSEVLDDVICLIDTELEAYEEGYQ
tara:strand:+ start:10962 stop:11144 length:183 start_codon:yes stop_codon:yes gene_type:complete